MMILSHNDRILRISNFCGENNYLPSMKFYYRKSLFKTVIGQNFIICQPIFNFLHHILGQNKNQILQRKYWTIS